MTSRREFLALTLAAACGRAAGEDGGLAGTAGFNREVPDRSRARLASRPGREAGGAPAGLSALHLAAGPRDALIYVPSGYETGRPAPFALMLHGAGGSARIGPELQELANTTGTILVAPDSRGQTWDILRGGYGPDVTFLDSALEWAFSRCAVDPTRVAIGGFSDGASYGLSVGLANGDLFTHIIAFSPGFMIPPVVVGKPRIFVSHGTRDDILPIDNSSRRFVPQLKRAGYRVRYEEFDGPHTVSLEIERAAFEWFTGVFS
jgi:phospholipase/carboxylesterase